MHSTQLQTEIEAVAARRDALRRELEAAQKTLTGAREATLSSKPKALDALATAQGRVTALTETMTALNARLELLQERLDAAREHEQREAAIIDLLRSDAEAEAAAREIEGAWSDFDTTARKFGERFIAARHKIITAQNQFRATLQILVPRFGTLSYKDDPELKAQLEATMRELTERRAKLAVVRSDCFRHVPRPSVIDDPHAYKRPPLLFNEAAYFVEQISLRHMREMEAASEADAPEAA